MICFCFVGILFIMEIFIFLKMVMVNVFGIGVVVINSIFGFWFLFLSFLCWLILNWCCLFVMIRFSVLNFILFWIKVWVFIKILIFLRVSCFKSFLCCFFLIEFVKSVMFIFLFVNNDMRELVCCLVRILVGIIKVFWYFDRIAVYKVMVVMVVFFDLILFCSRWFIW